MWDVPRARPRKQINRNHTMDTQKQDGQARSTLATGSPLRRYDTSKRIKFATDEWGGRDETHIEIEWNGQTLMIDITDERIRFVGCCFEVDKHSVNAMDITPHAPLANK
jgi:hypothetical protein